MKKNLLSNKVAKVLGIFLFSAAAVSCGSDDSPVDGGNLNKKSFKYTLTVDGPVEASDYISFVISGGAAGMDNNTLWKVNGETMANEEVLGFDDNDFTGSTKTYIIESVTPIAACAFGVQLINFNAPLKYAYKVEVNGETKVNETGTLVGDSENLTKNYSF